MQYYIKKPDFNRHSFAIYSRIVKPDGSTINKTVNHSDIEAINKHLRTGMLTVVDAERQVISIRNRLAGKMAEIFNADNERLLDKFLADYFREKPFVIDKVSAEHKYRRAVKALGKLPIMAVTRDQALDAVMKLPTNGKQREAAHKLNSLFTRLGREVVVPVPPEEHGEVNYISENELTALVEKLPDNDYKNAIILSFYGGLRIGELRALKANTQMPNNPNTLNVTNQLDVHERVRLPKNRKKRKAYLHDKGLLAFSGWVAKTETYSHKQLNNSFKFACAKHLNRNDLTWHDLRHSYAVHLLSSGVPIQLVAQSMGNSVRVCEKDYAGHIISDLGLENIARILAPK